MWAVFSDLFLVNRYGGNGDGIVEVVAVTPKLGPERHCAVLFWIGSLQGSQLPCCEDTQAAVRKSPRVMEPRPPDADSKFPCLKLGGAGLVVKISLV